MRSGVTVTELLVAMAIGVIVLGLLFAFSGSVERMSRSADLAGGLQEGVLALARIEEDLVHAVQPPHGKFAVRVTKKGFQLIRGEFLPDGQVRGKPVSYRSVDAGKGRFRLTRRYGTESTQLPGTFSAVHFARPEGAGGPFVRVSLVVSVRPPAADARPGVTIDERGSEASLLSVLVRVMGPEMVEGSTHPWSFLDQLGAFPAEEAP